EHYSLECGLLREGDSADFIVVDDLKTFNVLKTFVRGELVAENGKSHIPRINAEVVNNFYCREKMPEDFQISAEGKQLRVIEALDGQLITKTRIEEIKYKTKDGFVL